MSNTPSPETVGQCVDLSELSAKVHEAQRAYLENYELLGEDEQGRDAYYEPNEFERSLIEDAINGLDSDTDYDRAYTQFMQAKLAPEMAAELAKLREENELLNSLLRAACDSRDFNKAASDQLRAENAALRTAVSHAYTQGYRSGHHDTVEGGYTDVHHSDADTYFAEEAAEIITTALAKYAPETT